MASAAVTPLTRTSIVRLLNIERTFSRPRLALFSKIRSRPAYLGLCYPASERVVFVLFTDCSAAVDVGLAFHQRDRNTPPFVRHVWRTSGHRRYTRQSYPSETAERRRNGARALRRLIADSIRLLMSHPSVNSLCGVPEHRAIGRRHLRYPLGARILALVRLSLHSLDSFVSPRLLHLHTRAVLHLHIELNRNRDVSVDWNLLG